MNDILLGGCLPEPLLMNLKALGIFRILAEQKDHKVMAYWHRDKFVIHTKLNRDELLDFFLHEYHPTPIVSPWNNASGFYDNKSDDNSDLIKIERSDNPRLKEYYDVIKEVRNVLKECVPQYLELLDKNPTKELKDKIDDNMKKTLRVEFRNRITEKLIPWLDAAYVITSKKPQYGIVLGSAGNDGNFEISSNFMKCIAECILDDKDNKEWITGSLFGNNEKLFSMSSAFFYPEGYKGPNCGSDGYKDISLINPWDYMLMMEGTLFFAGSLSRRSISTKAAFPFTVNSSTAGYGTSCAEKSRGELWIPLWENPATYPEIKYLFSEGRSQIGLKHADTGCDFARAVASLGVQRGISGFQRFGILERKGQAYLANRLGRINVIENPQVNLFADMDDWLIKIRKAKNLSNSMKSLLNNMDDAIMKFCTNPKKQHMQDALIILGRIESNISDSSEMRENVSPLEHISFEWIDACYDETPEFRLAVSLASIYDRKDRYPIRCNLEQIVNTVKSKSETIKFISNSNRAVWSKNDTVQNMIAVLERRCIDAQMNNSTIRLDSKICAPLKDVLLFLEGKVNYEKIGNLLLPLSMIRYDYYPEYCNNRELWDIPEFIPESYVTIKSNFPPTIPSDNKGAKFEPSIIPLLKSGNIGLAQKIAQRRLFISGISPLTYDPKHSSGLAPQIPESMISRLAAACLFPLSSSDMMKIIKNISKQITV